MKKLLCFCLLIVFTFSFAQDGSPDLSFGDNGIIIHDLEGNYHEVRGVDEGFNGKIFAIYYTIGGSSSQTNRIFVFNQDGSLDETFGDNGILLLENEYNYLAIDILPNEKLLIQSIENSQYTVTRFMANGTIDDSFGNNGKIQPFITDGMGKYAIIDQDNSIIVLGIVSSSEPKLVFYKYFENGQPDNTFGNDGIVEYSLGNVANVSFTKMIQADNGIYIGIDFEENDNDLKNIFRFLLDGSADSSFGANGRMTIPIEQEYNMAFSVLQDGNILVGGSYQDATFHVNRKTIKLNSQGQIDQSFGDSGIIDGFTVNYIQENQSFISEASLIDFEMGYTPVFSRFYPDGTLDDSFQFSSNYDPVVGPYIIQPLQSGKFLMVGSEIWYHLFEIEIVLQRFHNNPLGISDFEQNEIVVYPNPSSGIFQIQNETPFYNTPFEVYDSLGRNVISGHFNENFPSINLSNVESGVYFLNIADSSQTFKLLKK